MKAKVKATGEIVEICFSPTNCMEAGGKRWWKTSELDFSSIDEDTINSDSSTEVFYDPQSMSARFFQDAYICITKEVVKTALTVAADKQLRDELKRRSDARKALKSQELRCRNCKYCIEGYTSRRSAYYGYKASVCSKKPKFQCEAYAIHYATSHSRKACDMFELK